MRLDRATLSTLMSVWWWVGSDNGIIYWREESSISVHWIRFLTDIPCFKQVFGDITCGDLHQQLSHSPKQCCDGGLLHVQLMRTYRGHRLSVPFCVL